MVIHLNLHRVYFEQIKTGEKTEEYREKKPFWDQRLFSKKYTHIRFSNGYKRDRPQMLVELNEITWDDQYYILHLGNIIE